MAYDIPALAARHGFTPDAVDAACAALRRGNGVMAQFDHPEFGGHGQWMPGMLMIGDLFNQQLKARVDNLFYDLLEHCNAGDPDAGTRSSVQYDAAGAGADQWYPVELGAPATSGGQNDVRYAYFPGPQRLAIQLHGKLALYETGDHVISGVSQGQSSDRGSLSFTSQHGLIPLSDLKVVK